MTPFRSKRHLPGVLLVQDAQGKEWRTELAPSVLAEFRERVLADAGAALVWERLQQVGTQEVLRVWPAGAPLPDDAVLRDGRRFRTGVQLDLRYAEDRGKSPGALGRAVARALSGRAPLEDSPAGVAAPEEAPAGTDTAPADGAGAATAGEAGASSGAAGEVEVLSPEAPEETRRRAPAEREDDVFAMATPPGEEAAAAAGDPSIAEEDLPWLQPGDLVSSSRRGLCRIKRVEDVARHVVVRNATGDLLAIPFRELVAEFAFADDL